MTAIPANQKGQAVTEAVLILTVLLGIVFTVTSFFKNEEILKQLITTPFASLAGMLEDGVWAPADKSAPLNPNAFGRHISAEGEHVQ